MKILLAGPDYGMELGWKLMRWQGILRAKAAGYDKVAVISDTFGMYRDFAEDAKTCYMGEKSMWRVMNPNIDRIEPCRDICCNASLPQKFYRYKMWTGISSKTILIHARQRCVGANRNWGEKKWKALIGRLQRSGYLVASIGTDVHNLDVDESYTNVGFEILCRVISSASILIGPSSGPMHLASVIGTPHLVWTDSRKYNLGGISGTNRKRYETVWNPYNTKCFVIDQYGWDPSPDVVYNGIIELLK